MSDGARTAAPNDVYTQQAAKGRMAMPLLEALSTAPATQTRAVGQRRPGAPQPLVEALSTVPAKQIGAAGTVAMEHASKQFAWETKANKPCCFPNVTKALCLTRCLCMLLSCCFAKVTKRCFFAFYKVFVHVALKAMGF